MKPAGKPDAGNPHVRFDERGGETGCFGDTVPLLDATGETYLSCAVRAPGSHRRPTPSRDDVCMPQGSSGSPASTPMARVMVNPGDDAILAAPRRECVSGRDVSGTMIKRTKETPR
jgi:hypothetical protein